MTQCGHPAMQAVVRSTSHNHTQVLDRRDHSALMLAARITLPHFWVSSAISFPKSAGEPASTVKPRADSLACIFGSARAKLVSRLSLWTISGGVLLGVPIPYQPLASKPGRKSATIGVSSQRVAVVTANARNLP